ncbi:hypothetical protein SERLADRAFT_400896 [Serpula lacrymans var. lacrymans S7.9]|uniref:Uncharacterized protein n=1 Tax=Serpula lacrymans var. lacrymans (strain S7.9) TaxID=578457 RepID=F8PAE4_SERL9|nr:uncharacterized protein SERLADRAFT_400896 [Serpula lacrymans var. lacrymans S7.9]EGO19783.1 hypothetical protein SERLADRAFT_400896 [Serpula lacrymans var. lacrymans S7.9]
MAVRRIEDKGGHITERDDRCRKGMWMCYLGCPNSSLRHCLSLIREGWNLCTALSCHNIASQLVVYKPPKGE